MNEPKIGVRKLHAILANDGSAQRIQHQGQHRSGHSRKRSEQRRSTEIHSNASQEIAAA
jgi:hypothetical protein